MMSVDSIYSFIYGLILQAVMNLHAFYGGFAVNLNICEGHGRLTKFEVAWILYQIIGHDQRKGCLVIFEYQLVEELVTIQKKPGSMCT
jgi:hypothetical protein